MPIGAKHLSKEMMMPSTNELVRKLYDVATCRVPHVFNGQCPDSMEGSDVRDPDCPACQVLIQVGRQLEGAKPHQAVEVAVKVGFGEQWNQKPT
ncbi:hypothetical protein FA331_12975 [Pseudomonas aeruginosa]|nr:hypothetical protein [Pseudomonas aeruginosa]MCO2541464.1 hypothetical protein [Pseudomonas aeruginosa]